MNANTAVTIIRKYDFEAAHQLPRVPDGHKCKNLHGHSYVVEVHLTGWVHDAGPEAGMVLDFGVLDEAFKVLHAQVDHTTLNATLAPNATVEVMAPIIHRHFNTFLWEHSRVETEKFKAGVRTSPPMDAFHLRIVLHEGPRSSCVYPPWQAVP